MKDPEGGPEPEPNSDPGLEPGNRLVPTNSYSPTTGQETRPLRELIWPRTGKC